VNKTDGEVCDNCLETPPAGCIIRTSADIINCVAHFRTKPQEYLICLSLNSRHQLIAKRIITIGLVDRVLAHPREVFAGPMVDRASGIVIAHNHPSGSPEPSHHDISLTQQIVAAGQMLGLPLHDHIIVSSLDYYSFKAKGML
jgi:DNA repair protein RadC